LNSVTTEEFRRLYGAASPQKRAQIKRAFKLWRENPAHPSLRFKKVHPTAPIYSAKVDLDWRALSVLDGDTVVWFWVRPHDAYTRMLERL
jgi:hypothetical protein